MKLPNPRLRGARLRRVLAAVVGLLCAAVLLPATARADNPIVQNIYTADPAPLVYNGRVYLYTGHDEDNSAPTSFTMRDWRVAPSSDRGEMDDPAAPLRPRALTPAAADAPGGQA